MKEAIIIGYSGHSFVVLDILILNQYIINGYCEKNEKKVNPYDLKYLGDEDNLELFGSGKFIFISIGDNFIRNKIFHKLYGKGIQMPTVFHPTSSVSSKTKIGLASVFMAGCIINTLSVIGNGVICNSGCVIEHECVIGDFVHIGPSAVLAGGVTIGDNSFIGANCVIKQGVKVGQNVVVGAGSVVLKDIKDNSIVYGNPSKLKLK
uniref:acetyltransferase n=1 Tax=Algoriphagus sp. TaxID=1872435 RepID=UPI0040485FF9